MGPLLLGRKRHRTDGMSGLFNVAAILDCFQNYARPLWTIWRALQALRAVGRAVSAEPFFPSRFRLPAPGSIQMWSI